MFKWELVNLMLASPSWTKSFHATETGDKPGPDGLLASYAEFTFTCLFVPLIISVYCFLGVDLFIHYTCKKKTVEYT